MSVRQLIPSLGKELDELRARLARLEGLHGVGSASSRGGYTERCCSWAYCNGICQRRNLPTSHPPSSTNYGHRGHAPYPAPIGIGPAAFPTRIFRQSKSLPRSYQALKRPVAPVSTRIHVRGIESLTKEDIWKYFETFGPVVEVTSGFKNFCFVEFDQLRVAQSLIGKELMIKGQRVGISQALYSAPLSPDNRRPRSPRGRSHRSPDQRPGRPSDFSPRRGRSPYSNGQNPRSSYSRGGTRRHYTPPPPLSPRPRPIGQMSPERQRHSLDGLRNGYRASSEKYAPPSSNLPGKGQVPPSSVSRGVSPSGVKAFREGSYFFTGVKKLLPSSSIPRGTPPFPSRTVATRSSCPQYTPGGSRMPSPAPVSMSPSSVRVKPLVTVTQFTDPDVSSSRNITVWFGTGHTHFSATTCKIDIVVNGVSQTQSKVLGRLQSITCMKKYMNKSSEELRWEDYTAGRKACSRLLCGKPEKTDAKGKDDEGGNLLKEKYLDGVVGAKEKMADGELHLAEGEEKGGELLKEKKSVEEVDGRSDELAAKELSCADSIGGRKVLTHTSSMQGCDIGVSLKEIGTAEVRKEDDVVEEKAVGGDSDHSSSMMTQIVSMRPKLKRKVKK